MFYAVSPGDGVEVVRACRRCVRTRRQFYRQEWPFRYSRGGSIIVCLFHKEKEKYEDNTKEDSRPVKYPSPSLVLSDKTTDDRCDIVASSQSKSIYAHIGSAFVGKILSTLVVEIKSICGGAHNVSDRNLWDRLDW